MIMALKDYQIEADFFREQQKKICIIVLTIFEICRQWKDVSEIPIVSFFNIKKIKAFNFLISNLPMLKYIQLVLQRLYFNLYMKV